MSSNRNIMLLGLSGTGKTNFLAALDVFLDEPPQTEVNALVHGDIAAERIYLQPIKAKWLTGDVLDHTSLQNTPEPHLLIVEHKPTKTKIEFIVPDLAGETFNFQFESRTLSHNFIEQLRTASGIILFLHCSHQADHEVIEGNFFAEDILEEPAQPSIPANDEAQPGKAIDLNSPQEQSSGAGETESNWKISDAARQIKLVDILQFVSDCELGAKPLSVAVVLSAWDVVENAPHLGENADAEIPKDPISFFKSQWPLLNQYLLNNSRTFQFRTYGVSARGGGNSSAEIERLGNIANPRDRIIVVDEAHRSSDISRPIRWILGLPQ